MDEKIVPSYEGHRRENLKRLTILVLALTLIVTSLSASGDLGAGVGLSMPAHGIVLDEEGLFEVPLDSYFETGIRSEVSGGWTLGKLFHIGLSASFSYNQAQIDDYDYLVALPLAVDFGLWPSLGQVRLPMTLSAGGYLEVLDGKLSYGPYLAASIGLSFPLGEELSLVVEAGAETFVQFADSFSTIAMRFGLSPLTVRLDCTI